MELAVQLPGNDAIMPSAEADQLSSVHFPNAVVSACDEADSNEVVVLSSSNTLSTTDTNELRKIIASPEHSSSNHSSEKAPSELQPAKAVPAAARPVSRKRTKKRTRAPNIISVSVKAFKDAVKQDIKSHKTHSWNIPRISLREETDDNEDLDVDVNSYNEGDTTQIIVDLIKPHLTKSKKSKSPSRVCNNLTNQRLRLNHVNPEFDSVVANLNHEIARAKKEVGSVETSKSCKNPLPSSDVSSLKKKSFLSLGSDGAAASARTEMHELLLQEIYYYEPYPSSSFISRISKVLQYSWRRVQEWFVKYRLHQKKMGVTVRYHPLNQCRHCMLELSSNEEAQKHLYSQQHLLQALKNHEAFYKQESILNGHEVTVHKEQVKDASKAPAAPSPEIIRKSKYLQTVLSQEAVLGDVPSHPISSNLASAGDEMCIFVDERTRLNQNPEELNDESTLEASTDVDIETWEEDPLCVDMLASEGNSSCDGISANLEAKTDMHVHEGKSACKEPDAAAEAISENFNNDETQKNGLDGPLPGNQDLSDEVDVNSLRCDEVLELHWKSPRNSEYNDSSFELPRIVEVRSIAETDRSNTTITEFGTENEMGGEMDHYVPKFEGNVSFSGHEDALSDKNHLLDTSSSANSSGDSFDSDGEVDSRVSLQRKRKEWDASEETISADECTEDCQKRNNEDSGSEVTPWPICSDQKVAGMPNYVASKPESVKAVMRISASGDAMNFDDSSSEVAKEEKTFVANMVAEADPKKVILGYECPICVKVFPSDWRLLRHSLSHQTFKCGLCPERFPNEIVLRDHLMSHVLNSLSQDELHAMKCSVCGQSSCVCVQLNTPPIKLENLQTNNRRMQMAKRSKKFFMSKKIIGPFEGYRLTLHQFIEMNRAKTEDNFKGKKRLLSSDHKLTERSNLHPSKRMKKLAAGQIANDILKNDSDVPYYGEDILLLHNRACQLCGEVFDRKSQLDEHLFLHRLKGRDRRGMKRPFEAESNSLVPKLARLSASEDLTEVTNLSSSTEKNTGNATTAHLHSSIIGTHSEEIPPVAPMTSKLSPRYQVRCFFCQKIMKRERELRVHMKFRCSKAPRSYLKKLLGAGKTLMCLAAEGHGKLYDIVDMLTMQVLDDCSFSSGAATEPKYTSKALGKLIPKCKFCGLKFERVREVRRHLQNMCHRVTKQTKKRIEEGATLEDVDAVELLNENLQRRMNEHSSLCDEKSQKRDKSCGNSLSSVIESVIHNSQNQRAFSKYPAGEKLSPYAEEEDHSSVLGVSPDLRGSSKPTGSLNSSYGDEVESEFDGFTDLPTSGKINSLKAELQLMRLEKLRRAYLARLSRQRRKIQSASSGTISAKNDITSVRASNLVGNIQSSSHENAGNWKSSFTEIKFNDHFEVIDLEEECSDQKPCEEASVCMTDLTLISHENPDTGISLPGTLHEGDTCSDPINRNSMLDSPTQLRAQCSPANNCEQEPEIISEKDGDWTKKCEVESLSDTSMKSSNSLPIKSTNTVPSVPTCNDNDKTRPSSIEKEEDLITRPPIKDRSPCRTESVTPASAAVKDDPKAICGSESSADHIHNDITDSAVVTNCTTAVDLNLDNTVTDSAVTTNISKIAAVGSNENSSIIDSGAAANYSNCDTAVSNVKNLVTHSAVATNCTDVAAVDANGNGRISGSDVAYCSDLNATVAVSIDMKLVKEESVFQESDEKDASEEQVECVYSGIVVDDLRAEEFLGLECEMELMETSCTEEVLDVSDDEILLDCSED
ncbi:uncharacterized protein LOC108667402 [Hyalella azteca]|uniref:Uncharacterized protein LOC108667402 n=1 Tax=Hyalella azteca TaxID=294128 RepID=A0A8B7N9G8_HYAAZ|nr:uncharacterized protein LOC108667402 [Hyalella azteca]